MKNGKNKIYLTTNNPVGNDPLSYRDVETHVLSKQDNL